MMKKILLTTLSVVLAINLPACPVCEKKQPKILRGITHGAGPESQWDYVIIWGIIAIVVFTLFFSLKYLIRPGEHAKTHIKHSIFNNE